jgi:hypothetical protein
MHNQAKNKPATESANDVSGRNYLSESDSELLQIRSRYLLVRFFGPGGFTPAFPRSPVLYRAGGQWRRVQYRADDALNASPETLTDSAIKSS